MNNEKSSPSIALCYVPEDDWLANAIAAGLEEKVFLMHVHRLCIRGNDNLRQKLDEDLSTCDYLLLMLRVRSIEKLRKKHRIDNDLIGSLNKRCKLILVVYGVPDENFPVDWLPKPPSKIDRFRVGVLLNIDPLAKHIQKLNSKPPRINTQSQLNSDYANSLNILDEENDARHISKHFLVRPEFRVEVDRIMKICGWNERRLELATHWLATRDLAKVEGKCLIGIRPAIDSFGFAMLRDDTRNGKIAYRCSLDQIDTLLLRREKFTGKIFNEEGSFELTLTVSADCSGKIVLDVEPVPKSLETDRKLLFVHSGKVSLDCVSVIKRNRKLISKNVQVRRDINKNPVPMWLETDEVVITDKSGNTALSAKDTTQITLYLSEFGCPTNICDFNLPPGEFLIDTSDNASAEPVEPIPAPYVEGLGSLTLKNTNFVGDRAHQRITAALSITAMSKVNSLSKWKNGVQIFLQRLIPVLEFAQGGKLFCPITELREGDRVETTYLRHSESAPQFMPVVQRDEDFRNLIVKVIEKQKHIEDKWQGIEEAISFALSAPNYGEARLLLNLIAIEKLVLISSEMRTNCTARKIVNLATKLGKNVGCVVK